MKILPNSPFLEQLVVEGLSKVVLPPQNHDDPDVNGSECLADTLHKGPSALPIGRCTVGLRGGVSIERFRADQDALVIGRGSDDSPDNFRA
jgi:hypothetical protein